MTRRSACASRPSGAVSGWAEGTSRTGSAASRPGSAGWSPVASVSGRWASCRKMRIAAHGLTTKAMRSEKTIATLAPTGMGRMYGPMSPRTIAIGRIAAITATVARMVGLPTSSTASSTSRAKLRRGPGRYMWRWMFSTTTIASSTRMPMEKMRANRVTRFSV